MFEIFVGLVALVIFYRVFPKSDKTDGESSILPFLDEEFRNNESKSNNEYYDWDDDLKDGCDSTCEDRFDETGDEDFDEEPFNHD